VIDISKQLLSLLYIQEDRMTAPTDIMDLTQFELNKIVDHIGNTPNFMMGGYVSMVFHIIRSANGSNSKRRDA
jgi:hypothetical protein